MDKKISAHILGVWLFRVMRLNVANGGPPICHWHIVGQPNLIPANRRSTLINAVAGEASHHRYGFATR
jgi:hypothetical protein